MVQERLQCQPNRSPRESAELGHGARAGPRDPRLQTGRPKKRGRGEQSLVSTEPRVVDGMSPAQSSARWPRLSFLSKRVLSAWCIPDSVLREVRLEQEQTGKGLVCLGSGEKLNDQFSRLFRSEPA